MAPGSIPWVQWYSVGVQLVSPHDLQSFGRNGDEADLECNDDVNCVVVICDVRDFANQSCNKEQEEETSLIVTAW